MKRNIFFTAIFGMAAIMLIAISCSKESMIIQDDAQIALISEDAEDAMIDEEILDEVLGDLEKYDFLKSAETCPVKTIVRPVEGEYPIIVTKDFGDGCYKYENGRMRSGKIIVTIFGPWRKKGSTRVVTFENYMHGKTLVDGEKEILSMGKSEEGYYWHKINGEIVLTREKDGKPLIINRKVKKDRYLINGYKDADTPKEWLIEGKVQVKKSNDVSYVVKIVEPLYRIQGCRWIQAGLKKIEFEEDIIQIDYGFVGEDEQSCDSWIKRWINDEKAEEIDLNAKH